MIYLRMITPLFPGEWRFCKTIPTAKGRPKAALPRVQPPLAAPQVEAKALVAIWLTPTAEAVKRMKADADVLEVLRKKKLGNILTALDPAPKLVKAAETFAVPSPPTTSSVSAELNSRIIMSLSRSSNVPASYLILISLIGGVGLNGRKASGS